MASSITQQDFNKIKGIEKAAIILLSLPDKQVTTILKALDEFEVRDLTLQMAQLGQVDAEVVEKLFLEFTGRVASTGSLMGNLANAEKLLLQVFEPDQVDSILSEMKGPAGRTMWEKLANVDVDILAAYLKGEHPQTIAVIPSQISPGQSSKVLATMEKEQSLDIMMRMLKLDNVHRDILNDIEKTLRGEFISTLSGAKVTDPYEKMAEIFNAFDRQTEEKMFDVLSNENSEHVDRIRSLMFTFDDILKLDGAAIQTVIRFVDNGQLALALKGASDQMKELFFGNMSERAGKLMKEDMEAMGMVKLRDVDEAQQGVTIVTKDLIDKGEVELVEEGEEEAMVG